MHDRELDDVVPERKHAREDQPRHRPIVQRPHALQDLEVRHVGNTEDLRPLARHRLLEEHGDGQEEQRGRDRHVGDRVEHVELRLAEHASQRQVQRAAQQRGHAHDHPQHHVAGALALRRRAHDPRQGEDRGACDADDHEDDLLWPARLEGVQIEQREALLGEESRQRQARADDQIHRDADVAQTEIVERNIEREHAAKHDHAEYLESAVELLRSVPVRREPRPREEEHEDYERDHLLHGRQGESRWAARQIGLERGVRLLDVSARRHCHRGSHNPPHVDVHEGLRPEVKHELPHGVRRRGGHHRCADQEAHDRDDEGLD
mmetsp:Transcript_1730/g.5107  ORF Transcript_1730/g.5107 Transcript_1730/m.5107 type:complete len:320 (-) Transcript_1730:142-1101(-)